MNIPEGYVKVTSGDKFKGDIRVSKSGDVELQTYDGGSTVEVWNCWGGQSAVYRKLPTKKPVRATSRAAWKLIKDSELLPKSHKLIIAYLCTRKQPVTSGEIEAYLQNSSAHKRLSELRNAGYIEECEKRKCSITGVEALTWKVSIV